MRSTALPAELAPVKPPAPRRLLSWRCGARDAVFCNSHPVPVKPAGISAKPTGDRRLDNRSLAVIRVATGTRCAPTRIRKPQRRVRLAKGSRRPQSRPHWGLDLENLG